MVDTPSFLDVRMSGFRRGAARGRRLADGPDGIGEAEKGKAERGERVHDKEGEVEAPTARRGARSARASRSGRRRGPGARRRRTTDAAKPEPIRPGMPAKKAAPVATASKSGVPTGYEIAARSGHGRCRRPDASVMRPASQRLNRRLPMVEMPEAAGSSASATEVASSISCGRQHGRVRHLRQARC